MLSQKIFANIYFPKITPMVLSETKLFLGGNMLIFIIIINIFTFPPNLPLTKGGLWQGCTLLAYGDRDY